MANRRKAPEDKEILAPLWVVTYGDLISLLVTFFVLIFTFSSLDSDKFNRARGALRGALGVMTPSQTRSRPNIVKTRVTESSPTSLQGTEELPEGRELELEQSLLNKVQGSEFDVPVSVQRVGGGFRVSLLGDNLFAPGATAISPKGRELAKEVALFFRELPVRLVIEAHTDDQHFRVLGFETAEDLTRLMALGVGKNLVAETGWDASRIGVSSMGSARPTGPNDSSLGRRKNRRIEILVINDGKSNP